MRFMNSPPSRNRFVFVHLQQFDGEDSTSFSPLRVVGESIVCMFKVRGQGGPSPSIWMRDFSSPVDLQAKIQ